MSVAPHRGDAVRRGGKRSRGTAAHDDFGSVVLGGVWTFSLLLPCFVAYWIELDPQALRCPIPPIR